MQFHHAHAFRRQVAAALEAEVPEAYEDWLAAGAEPVTAVQSPPLGDLVAVMNRESINIFAENIFRAAVRGPRRDGVGTAAAGNQLLQQLLQALASAAQRRM